MPERWFTPRFFTWHFLVLPFLIYLSGCHSGGGTQHPSGNLKTSSSTLKSNNYTSTVSPGKAPLHKLNGVSFVSPPRPISTNGMAGIQQSGANWVAIIPYAHAYAGKPEISYEEDRRWWGEGPEGVARLIQYAHELGYQVMLKPHVWVIGQGWPGEFTLDTEEDWQTWEQNYTRYLEIISHIADTTGVELLCVGTEYRLAVRQRPDFWKKLIQDIRKSYGGKLTYAANWDNFEQVSFWTELDYIGIDAYFPLCDDKTPSVANLKAQWEQPLQAIRQVQQQVNKPVLFTEYGYESLDYTSKGHWELNKDTLQVNYQAQVNAYEAMYQTFWPEPWFAGGFLWKWFPESDRLRNSERRKRGFTPQYKPVLGTIETYYRKHGAIN